MKCHGWKFTQKNSKILEVKRANTTFHNSQIKLQSGHNIHLNIFFYTITKLTFWHKQEDRMNDAHWMYSIHLSMYRSPLTIDDTKSLKTNINQKVAVISSLGSK